MRSAEDWDQGNITEESDGLLMNIARVISADVFRLLSASWE